jgi:hypothetical protein
VKIIYTLRAIKSIQQTANFLSIQGLPDEKIDKIVGDIDERVESLSQMAFRAQTEESLDRISLKHRRLVFNQYKIIYYIQDDCIYITDIFDSRQDPSKMKG